MIQRVRPAPHTVLPRVLSQPNATTGGQRAHGEEEERARAREKLFPSASPAAAAATVSTLAPLAVDQLAAANEGMGFVFRVSAVSR